MKKLLFITTLFISTSAFCQTKVKDREALASKKDTAKWSGNEGTLKNQKDLKDALSKPPVVPSYILVLNADQWQYLFKIIRTNAKLTSVQAEDYIEAITQSLKPVSDSTTKK